MARPSVDPEWATSDQVDPTSGQNNKVEPPSSWKQYGWSYQEKPPRNYDNYMKWNLGQWIMYLDTALGRGGTFVVAATDAAAESKNHADYVCDGTNDEVQIQAAIDAANTAGGGLVLLTEGTFTILDGIDLKSSVHVRGMGKDATEVKVSGSASTNFSVFDASSISRTSVQMLFINGNAASISQNHIGIDINASSYVVVRDVQIQAIDRDTSDGDGIAIVNSTQVHIDTCEISSCVNDGINITGSSTHSVLITGCDLSANPRNIWTDSNVLHVTIANNVARDSSTGNGMTVQGTYCKILGNDVRGNDDNGIDLRGTYCVVEGNICFDNGENGISLVGADYNVISNNLCRGNSQTTDVTDDGIDLDATSDSNIVVGNLVHKGSATNTQKYGIDCGSPTNYVVSNYLLNGGTTGNLNGTVKTSWGSNQIYDGVSSHVAITGSMVNVTA